MSGLDLRAEPFVLDEGALQTMVSGYLLSSVLFSAVELALFDHLQDRPSSPPSLARHLQLDGDGLERLLVALAALGLVRRDSDGLYHNEPLAADALTGDGARSIVPLVRHHQRHSLDLFAHLTEGVRSGEPQFARWRFVDGAPARDCYAELARHPDEYALLLRAMDCASRGVGDALARQAELDGARTLIDLGGGGGQVAVELATRLPRLHITLVDVPAACRYAEARIAAAGLGARIRCVAADLREDVRVLEPVDTVLLSGVLGDFAALERATLLARAARLLVPGGRLLVSETLFNARRSGPALPALLSLFMLLSTRGDNFTERELSAMLHKAGLVDIVCFHNGALGLRDLMVGRRAT